MRDEVSRTVGLGALDRPPTGAAPSAIPDVLGRGLRVLFCGINPGRVSAAAAATSASSSCLSYTPAMRGAYATFS